MSQTISPAAPGGAPMLPPRPGMSALSAMAGQKTPPVPQPPLPPTNDANTEILADEVQGRPDMDHAGLLRKWVTTINIADELDDSLLGNIGMTVGREYELDESSRAEWLEKYRNWMERALQVTQPKTYPWVGASNVIFPMMTTASVQFAARAYPAIIQNENVVKGVVEGSSQDDVLQEKADRIGNYMSWQLLEEMEEWEGETDKLLHILPIVGSCFRKSYFDASVRRNVSRMVSSDKVCVNYKAVSFTRAPRVTEIIEYYPHEVETKMRSGEFLEYDYKASSNQLDGDMDAPITFLEQHRRWDLDEDGYDEPYIITVQKDSLKVARIVANYDFDSIIFAKSTEEDEMDRVRQINPVAYFTAYEFLPNPDGGVYGIGFGHLLYPLNSAIDTSLNQLLDAGHLANTGGGFIGKGVSLSSGSMRFAPGEYKQVNVQGPALKDNIVPLPFAGPNTVLFALLQFLVAEAKEVASIKDILMGQQPGANVAATTVLALVEQGMQVFSAIYKRIHRSLKSEYRKLFRLNRLYMDEVAKFQKGTQWLEVKRADFTADAGCAPISDPTMVSNMQKLARANFLMGFKGDPVVNQLELHKRILTYAGTENIDALLIENPPPDPQLQLAQANLDLQKQIASEELTSKQFKDSMDYKAKQARDAALNVLTMSQAYNQLAQAEKAAGDNDRQWLTHKLEFFRSEIDRWGAIQAAGGTGAGDTGSGGAPAPNAPPGGNIAPPVQRMAQPPGVGTGAPLPAPPSA